MSEALKLAELLERDPSEWGGLSLGWKAAAELRRLSAELEKVRQQMEAQKDEWLSWEAKRSALEKDAGRWRTFLSTRPQATHEVINQAIDDAAMKGTP